jgi:hypothetical protein
MDISYYIMPRLRTLRTHKFPEGWEDVEPTIREI